MLFERFIAKLSDKFRVGREHVDGELHLINGALPSRLGRIPQFEIFQSVVGSLSVDVMDIFVGQKRATKMLLNNIAVFENFVPLPAIHSLGNVKTNVSALNSAAVLFAPKSLNGRPTAIGRPARLVAKSLLRIVLDLPARPLVLASRLFLSAMLAHKGLFFFGLGLTSNSGALAGAVKRPSSILLFVLSKIAGLNAERLAALFAVKHDHRDALVRSAVDLFVGDHARLGAKPARRIGSANTEDFSAIFAGFFNLGRWASHDRLLSVQA